MEESKFKEGDLVRLKQNYLKSVFGFILFKKARNVVYRIDSRQSPSLGVHYYRLKIHLAFKNSIKLPTYRLYDEKNIELFDPAILTVNKPDSTRVEIKGGVINGR